MRLLNYKNLTHSNGKSVNASKQFGGKSSDRTSASYGIYKNTKFFHLAVNIRKSRKIITRIDHNNMTRTSPKGIKEATVSYFSSLFTEDVTEKARMGSDGFSRLSPTQVKQLEQDTTMEEVRQTMWMDRRLQGQMTSLLLL
jgi:hypothetical protein